MEKKRFPGTDVRTSTIGQGTWRMGESARDRDAEIAEAIRGRRREDLFFASKVLPENAAALDFELSPEDVARIDAAFPAPSRPVPLATG